MNPDGSVSLIYVGPHPTTNLVTRLRERGGTVECMTSLVELVESVSVNALGVDCVICEHTLPDADGVTALRRVRQTQPHLPFVLLARDHEEAIAQAAFAADVTDYVPSFDAVETDVLATRILDVATRTQLAHDAQEAADIYRATLHNITDTVLLTDDDGNFTYVCPNVSFIFGYSYEQVVEMGAIDELLGYDPVDLQELESSGVVENTEVSVTDASGTQHVLLVTVRDVSIGDGTRLYSCRDITKRKRVERTLESQNRRLQTLVTNAPTILFALDEDGVYTVSEGRSLSALDLESGEVVGESIYDLFGDQPQVIDPIERALDGESVHTEMPVADALFEVWLEPIPDDTESEDAVIGVAIEITQRKRQERKLEESQAILERTQELAGVGGWRLDLQTDDLSWTSQTKRIHDVPPTYEPSVDTAIEFYHPDDRETISQLVESCIEEGEPYDAELRIITDTGRLKWVRTQGEPVVEDGDVVQIRGMVQDVTERKERTQQLRVIGRVLRHNLRNDMNVILGRAQNIEEGAEDETMERNAKAIVQRSLRLHELAEEANDFDQLLLQDPSPPTSLELSGIVETVVASHRRDEPRADISHAVPEGLCATAIPSIRWALSEIVENAIWHNDRETPRVDITADRTDSAVEIHVADNGPGIPDNEVEILTGEKQVRPLYHGSGFGLWVSQWIVSQSGGTIRFDQNDPRGSVVTVRLPAADT